MPANAVLVSDGGKVESIVLERLTTIFSRAIRPPMPVRWSADAVPPARSDAMRQDFEAIDYIDHKGGRLHVFGLLAPPAPKFELWRVDVLVTTEQIRYAVLDAVALAKEEAIKQGLLMGESSVVILTEQLDHPRGIMLEVWGAARRRR